MCVKLPPKDLNSNPYSLHLINTYIYTTLLVFELLKPSRLVTYVVLNFCYWCGCLTYDKGCVFFKYEKLPKFVAGVNCLTHDNNDYSRWIQSKGTLREEDKKFGAWQRVTHSYFFRFPTTEVEGNENQAPSYNSPRRREAETNHQPLELN